MVPCAHSNRQTKQHLEQFSCFCTAHSRASLYFTMGRPPLKIAPYHGDLDLPDLSHDSLGPSNPKPERYLTAVLHSWRQTQCVPVLYSGWPPSPVHLIIALPMGNVVRYLIHVPWAHPSLQSKWHLDRFSRFCMLTTVTDWQSAHVSPQLERQIDWFSRFCTAHGKKSIYFTMGHPFPQNCPFSWCIWTWGDVDPMIPWAVPRSQSKLHDDRFSRFRTGDCIVSLYFAIGATFPKNCPFPWGIWTPI